MASDKISRESFQLLVNKIGIHILRPQGYSNELTYSIAQFLRNSDRFQAGSAYQRGVILYHLSRGQCNFSVADHGHALSKGAVDAFFKAMEAHLGQKAEIQILTQDMVQAALDLRNIVAADKDSLPVPLVAEKPLPKASAYCLAPAGAY